VGPFLILLVVVVGVVIAVYLQGGSQPVGRRDPGILRRRSKWRRWLPILPLVAAVGCLALAFGGFRFSFQQTAPITMLAMDVSDSMNATDMIPNRLVAAQRAAERFLGELPPDFRVGLATFAGDAALAVPPTEDHGAVLGALDGLSTSNGTVIGDGLDKALDAIEKERAGGDAPAAVLLLSDGKDLGSLVAPHDAAVRARDMGVPVYTVLAGQVAAEGDEGAADPATLEDIARTSDGAPFTAETTDELTERFASIGSQLSVDLAFQPSATPLVMAALALVVFAGILLVVTPR
jgi:Ca-activated chloride channel homolog